jgi:hypothetical protein
MIAQNSYLRCAGNVPIQAFCAIILLSQVKKGLSLLDIWPKGDLALAVALQRVKGWLRRPSPEAVRKTGSEWQPWRAVAERLLWHIYLSERSVAPGQAIQPPL